MQRKQPHNTVIQHIKPAQGIFMMLLSLGALLVLLWVVLIMVRLVLG